MKAGSKMQLHAAVSGAVRIVEYLFLDAPASFRPAMDAFKANICKVRDPTARPKFDWPTVDYLSFQSSLTSARVLEPIRFCGRVESVSQPYIPEDLIADNIQIVDITLTVRGQPGIRCVPVRCDGSYADLLRSTRVSEPLEFRGFFALCPKFQSKKWQLTPLLYLDDWVVVDSVLQHIEASVAERDAAETIVQHNPDQLQYLRDQVVSILGIKKLDSHQLLKTALDAVVLQALGVGTVNGNTGSIHTLAIGPPAVGKKLIAAAAKVLSPSATEAHSSKCTVAGIQSAARPRKEGGFESVPGLIPLADRGVFIIQDFHGVKDKAGVLATLSNVMEEGRLIDSTAAQQVQVARTAIHLDLNRQTDLDPAARTQSALDDISMKLHILSRFDYIVEMPRDPERQKEVMEGMLSQNTLVGLESYGPGSLKNDARRELQVIVAYLRDTFEGVLIEKSIGDLIAG
jgi:hypothetical protein